MRYVLSSLWGVLPLALLLVAPRVRANSEDDGVFPRAVHLLNNGVYFEAASLLEPFVDEHPAHEAANLHLARALYHLKRNTQAAHRAAEVLRINPGNRAAKRLLTQLRIALGRELNTSDPQAVLAYARLCKFTDSYGRAAAFYERYLVYRPEDAETRLDLARLLSWSGRYERSAHHYAIYLEHLARDDNAIQYEYARVLNSAGRFSEAVASLDRCHAAEPGRTDVLLDLARACWWSGDVSERIPIFQQAVQAPVESLEDLNFLVSVARKLNWADAEYQLYEKILALDPDDRRAFASKSAYDDSQVVETLRLRKLVAGDPENTEYRRDLLKHFIRHEKLGEALSELKQLPKNDPVYLELSATVEKLRREVGQRTVALLRDMEADMRAARAERVAACRAWLEEHPDDHRTRSVLAYYLDVGEQPDDAAQQYRIILKTYPTVNPTIAARVKVLDEKKVGAGP